jgi:secondary thiamine-phosphate synthase enzyme
MPDNSDQMLIYSDSVSHLKTSLIGSSITIPISKGKLVFGTWQGIYLAEFRHSGAGWGGRGEGRKVIATIL